MNHPAGHTGALIKQALVGAPICELKDVLARARQPRKEPAGRRPQWNNVRSLVLGALARKIYCVGLDFRPAQLGNLTAALAGEEQQLDDRAVGVGTGGVPDALKLVI